MQPIDFLVSETCAVPRRDYIVEQGIPIRPARPDCVDKLAVFDESGRPVPAQIDVEGTDQHGMARWLFVSFPVTLEAGGRRSFRLLETDPAPQFEHGLEIDSTPGKIVVRTRFFALELADPGGIRLTTDQGTVLDGSVGFEIRSDARSAVGNLRPVHFEPQGYEIIERGPRRAKFLLKGRYRAWTPKAFTIDPEQRFDADVEFAVYADSPVIRFRWCITDFMKFNCSYMWLDRYTFSLPLADGSLVVQGAQRDAEVCGRTDDDERERFADWVTLRTPGGKLSMTFPFYSWLGKGAGIEVADGRVAQGGIDPPPDGGFGGKNPDIWRKFYYGMSRTFEGALLVNHTEDQLISELNPIPIILSPQYYSAVGALPEDGSEVTFGPWKDVVERAAAHLLDTQWKGTLWFGEWWRERDVDHDLGIEETNSGNSAIGPLLHFYRTGDRRFFESAKMSYYYTWDIQFCKRTDHWGPYMHTRRFLLDHQEWFHPRYQRIGGMIRCSHVFGHKTNRDKVIWLVRFWGENYVAGDGAMMAPHGDGREGRTGDWRSKCGESAMTNFIDSLMYAYIETADEWFLEKSKLIGDWIISGINELGLDKFCENSNSTRYILRGLMQLCKETGEQRYIDAFCKIAKWTVNSPTFDFGTHYVAFHFWYACQAYKWCGDREILEGILRLALWVLSKESEESPGTYPFLQRNQYPPARWICIYDNKAIVSYLPVLAATLKEAGIQPPSEN